MIQLFKKNDLTNIIILIPYAIILRLYSFIHPKVYIVQEYDGLLSTFIFKGLDTNPLAQSIIALVLIYIQANLINLLVNKNRLLSLPSALPGLVYVILVSILPEFQGLSPVLIGITFVILASFSIFNVYKSKSATIDIFNSAMYLSVATLFYPPFAIATIPILIEIAILKSFKFKERLQFLSGFLILYWIVGSFLFFYNQLNLISINSLNVPGSILTLFKVNLGGLLGVGVVLGLVTFSLFNYYNYMKKKGIEARKKIDFFYWLMLSTMLALFCFLGIDYGILLFLSLPLSLFIGMSFLIAKNASFAELVHLLFIIGIFFIQFGQDLSVY